MSPVSEITTVGGSLLLITCVVQDLPVRRHAGIYLAAESTRMPDIVRVTVGCGMKGKLVWG